MFTLTVLYWLNSKVCKQYKAKENKDTAQKQSFNMILQEKGLTLPKHNVYMQLFGHVTSKAGISLKYQCSVSTYEDLAKRSGVESRERKAKLIAWLLFHFFS